jgi:sigma-B regulation protein RsbU (phosphoserine phosphatase)
MAIACRDSRGTEFLDEMFWHLTRSLPNGARPDDDVSAALLEYRCYPDDG